MKFLRILLIIIVILAVIVGILTMIAPTKLLVQRSLVINAPREVVYKNISTFENLHKWSPWDRKDPYMKHSIEGTDGTVGATWRWESNNKEVGKGDQTFTKIDPGNEVDMHLNLISFGGEAETMLLLNDTTGGTNVTWQFKSDMPRPFNIMSLFMNPDASIGKEFEAGLNNLKELSEKDAMSATPVSSGYQIIEMDMPAKVFVGKRDTVPIQDIGKFFAENIPNIFSSIQKAKLEVTGPTTGIFYSYNTEKMNTDMAAVFPVKEVKTPPAGWQVINVPAGKALMVDYIGNYNNPRAIYKQLAMYGDPKSMKMKLSIEEYVIGPPMEKDTAKWETKIYYYAE